MSGEDLGKSHLASGSVGEVVAVADSVKGREVDALVLGIAQNYIKFATKIKIKIPRADRALRLVRKRKTQNAAGAGAGASVEKKVKKKRTKCSHVAKVADVSHVADDSGKEMYFTLPDEREDEASDEQELVDQDRNKVEQQLSVDDLNKQQLREDDPNKHQHSQEDDSNKHQLSQGDLNKQHYNEQMESKQTKEPSQDDLNKQYDNEQMETGQTKEQEFEVLLKNHDDQNKPLEPEKPVFKDGNFEKEVKKNVQDEGVG